MVDNQSGLWHGFRRSEDVETGGWGKSKSFVRATGIINGDWQIEYQV